MNIKRDYGIDLLRAILMVFIIIGHLFAHSGIRDQVSVFSSKWLFTWATQSITVCAVNCFVIITGYYLVDKSFDLYKLGRLWAKVLFYSVAIGTILVLTKMLPLSTGQILDTIFPVLRCEYWFFTMYILLYLLIPFLNAGINSITKEKLGVLVAIILLAFYVEPLLSAVFYQYDVTEGFSILAFITLYVVGAYLSRCKVFSKKVCLCVMLASSASMLLSKMTLEMIANRLSASFGTGLLYHNNSIFVLINAVALFEFFKQVEIKKEGVQKVVMWVSPSVFAVYLLHEKPAIRALLWNKYLLDYLKYCSFLSYVLVVIGSGISIFAIGIAIDKTLNLVVFKRFGKTRIVGKIRCYCDRYNAKVNC